MLPSSSSSSTTTTKPNNTCYEIEGVGFAVAPKTDCPHFDSNVHFSVPWNDRKAIKELFTKDAPCKHCKSTAENWFCLGCQDVCCSRYQKSHMVQHYEQTGHSLVLSLADHSLYCYECDAYVENKALTRLLLRELHYIKFGEYPGAHGASVDMEEAIDKLRNVSEQIAEEKKKEDSEKERAFEILAEKIQSATDESIIVLTGAGLSTSAGIPDFRTPGTGLYDNLQKYSLPRPTAIFELHYLPTNPHPFFHLSRDFISSGYKPTKAHYFIKLLEEKNKLKRLYTQNIDGLEAKSGITKDRLVNCHGMYDLGHCIKCNMEYALSEIVEKMGTEEEVQIPKCDKCGDIVKPDIVLFGEDLPQKYKDCYKSDLIRSKDCEVFIVIGTSLSVYPVAGLPGYSPEGSTRALMNREKCGPFSKINGHVTEIGEESKCLDLFLGGQDYSIDECVEKVCKLLGWEAELEELHARGPIDLLELSIKK